MKQPKRPLYQTLLLPLLLAAGVLAVEAPALAHHAFAAEFDADQPIDIKGVVTKLKLVNPHSWLYLDVKDDKGVVTNWGVEFGAPNSLAQRGLNKGDIQPGDVIQIKGFRAKNGGPFGYSSVAVLKDGRVIQTGGATDVPAAPTAAPVQR